MKEYLKDFFSTSYHIKSSVISIIIRLFTVSIAIIFYILLITLLDEEIEQVALFSFGVVVLGSVLFLMPLQERLTIKLKNLFLSEYLTDDLISSRAAQRRLDLYSLVRYVFPDMVKLTGSASGKLAILDTRLTGFMIYNYSRGRQRKIKTREILTMSSPLVKYLISKKKGISIGETVNDHEVNEGLIALRSNYILPFFFREKMFGFLATTNIPPHDEIANLHLLASKAALAVHNYMLTSTVVEHLKYRKEFDFADKIQDLMLNVKIPTMEKIEVLITNKDPSLIVEFFLVRGKWNFLITGIAMNHKGGGLVLSYLLGVIYSRYKSGTFTGISSIFNLVKTTLDEISYRDDYCMVSGVVHPDELSVELMYSGKGISMYCRNNVYEPREGKKTAFPLDDCSLIIKIKDCTIIEFRKKI